VNRHHVSHGAASWDLSIAVDVRYPELGGDLFCGDGTRLIRSRDGDKDSRRCRYQRELSLCLSTHFMRPQADAHGWLRGGRGREGFGGG